MGKTVKEDEKEIAVVEKERGVIENENEVGVVVEGEVRVDEKGVEVVAAERKKERSLLVLPLHIKLTIHHQLEVS